MEQFYILILAFLVILSVFDLFVGVSNDAVNFMNSAIGSRITSFRIVLIVACIGVLIGATFSSGMMEIARSGVFNPNMLTFSEIIIIFFAVMLTDVLLLDIFNSFGLPTSTTVSIVFELLGGAVAVAVFKIWNNPGTTQQIGDFINNEKALSIVTGIFTSVIVAFTAGSIVQFIARMIFTFKYQKIYKYAGSTFGAIALTAILYFLVMKGAKGASFMKPEYLKMINDNTIAIITYTFIGLTTIFQILISLFNFNIFKIIILSGTFALAFAFAGNDLVNFVGVPLAAIDSYKAYMASGAAADVFTMESLKEAVQTPTIFLIIAGIIMVITLWTSKKARRVIETELSLSSASRGAKEKFGSSAIGRTIVRSSINANKVLHQIMPAGFFTAIENRMEEPEHKKGDIQLPFDHIRASVNLLVSSILIASATSLKLPLSTTYVTFMVAMGSSLADGAWDRESAVYRISGVLTVIGGWFMTAFSAFILCFTVGLIILYGGQFAAIGLMLFTSFILIRSNFFAKGDKERHIEILKKATKIDICNKVNSAAAKNLDTTISLYKSSLNNFMNENRKAMKKNKMDAATLFDDISQSRTEYYNLALEDIHDKIERDARHYYYRVFTNMKELSHTLRNTIGAAFNHIDNHHSVFHGILRENIYIMISDLEDLQKFINNYVTSTENNDNSLTERSEKSVHLLNKIQGELLARIDEENLSLRNSEMYLSFIQFSRDLINRYTLIALLEHELNVKCGVIKLCK